MLQILLEIAQKRLNISETTYYYIGFFFIIIAYIIMNFVFTMSEKQIELYTSIFFKLIAVSFLFFSISTKKRNIIVATITDLSVANIIDEFSGNACIIQWYELPLALIIFISNYLIYKIKWMH